MLSCRFLLFDPSYPVFWYFEQNTTAKYGQAWFVFWKITNISYFAHTLVFCSYFARTLVFWLKIMIFEFRDRDSPPYFLSTRVNKMRNRLHSRSCVDPAWSRVKKEKIFKSRKILPDPPGGGVSYFEKFDKQSTSKIRQNKSKIHVFCSYFESDFKIRVFCSYFEPDFKIRVFCSYFEPQILVSRILSKIPKYCN